jgi:hypothetical protein
MKIIFAVILIAVASVVSAQSQAPAENTALRLVEEGKAWLTQNELKKADEAFRVALKGELGS